MKRQHRSRFLPLAVIGMCVFVLVSCARKVELDEDFQKILTYNFGDSREPLTVIQDRVRSTYGNTEARLNIELQLAELLKKQEATWACKDFACRQLRLVGTKESIPALASLLTDEKLSDMARYALELNTDPGVDKVLVKALGKAQGNQLIGIINTLGDRKTKDAVDALRPLSTGQNADVAAAAKDALTKIQGG